MTLLTRWDPRELSTMQDRMNRMNRLFRESYSPEGPEEALTSTSFAPPVDIYEDEHTIVLKMEVRASRRRTSTSASRTTPSPSTANARLRKRKEENFRRVERQYGSFTRSFTLPSSVDPGQVARTMTKAC